MVKKSLPKVKKSLKSFILEEDAKVIDKSMVKIAVVTSFAGIMIIDSIDDANALFSDKYDKHCHNNELNVISNKTNIQGINPNDAKSGGLTGKSITTVHGNHFNHANGKVYNWWGSDVPDCEVRLNIDDYRMSTPELDLENKYNPESDGDQE